MSPGSSVRPVSLRWCPRAYLLLVVAGALLVAAVAERNPVPLYLALPFLLAGPAAALSGPRTSPRVGVSWLAEGSGMDVRIAGSIQGPERVDSRDLYLELPRPAGLTEVAPPTFERTREAVRFRFFWRATEPIITSVSPPRLVWRDAVGLAERPASADVSDLLVERYPPELLRIGPVRLRRTMVFPGETTSRQVGPAGEFFGIRDAAPADPPRRINWRASARTGRLLANEFQLDRTGDVLLVLDTRISPLGPTIDDRLLAITRAAAAGIADSFLHEKARVGLGVFGEFLDAVPLGTGRAQRVRIRNALLKARLNASHAPSERCAISLGRYFPPGMTTILFSTLSDDSTADLLPYLRRRGFSVVVLSPSPLPVQLEGTILAAEDEALAARLMRLLRRNRVASAWREAPTIDWEDYWSLGHFVEFLRRPGTRRLG
jgi:uncharacterized protein (DUF58 family)